MGLIKWVNEKIFNFLHVKNNSNGRKFIDMSDMVFVRSNSAAEKINKCSLKLIKTHDVSFYSMSCPNDNIDHYIYSHEYSGKQVAFVPFRKAENGKIQILLKSEIVPCWNYNNPVYSSFTYYLDEGSTPLQIITKKIKWKILPKAKTSTSYQSL